jgi:integrase
MTPQSVRLILESMAKRARISVDYSPHSLRAGFATAAAKAGIADRAIMRQTRHKSVQMLSRYVQEGSAFIAGVDALL